MPMFTESLFGIVTNCVLPHKACCYGVVDALNGNIIRLKLLETYILQRHYRCLSIIWNRAIRLTLSEFTLTVDGTCQVRNFFLRPFYKSHDLVVIVFESIPINLWLVCFGKYFEVLVDVPLRVVEKVKICWVLLFKSLVVFEVKVNYPLKIFPPGH